jgi:hypothetical protein
MGVGREAVVDAELRVRGVLGLRIADAWVMPTIPVMIGEFASRLLVAGGAGAFPEPPNRTHTPLLKQPSRAEE